MKKPTLSFACELETDALQALFADPAIIPNLQALDAGVTLGLLDLSPERAAVVRQLNEAGIPVVAWLLLSKEQGYWFNIDNAPQATAFYTHFKAWTQEHDLKWAGVGLDIEPDYDELGKIVTGNVAPLIPRFLRRLFDNDRVLNGRLAYGALVRDIRSDGYPVETYQFPLIVDERKSSSTLLQRLFGIVDIPTDRETLMLYTSFWPGIGPAVLCSYAPEADAIAVGSTGGGEEVKGMEPLTWEAFTRDLRLAYRWNDTIFVYSLEGCVQQRFLSRLRDFEWQAPLVMPTAQIEQVNQLRAALRGILWAANRPLLVLAGLTATVLIVKKLRRLLSGVWHET